MPQKRTLSLFGLLSLIVAILHSFASSLCAAPTNPSGFIIRRGVNLSHWLSQDFNWKPRATWITANDIRYIASLGFDHVRLPIDEKELWLENGKPNEQAFALLETALGWCEENHLRVIVDLHTIKAHHFNAENEGLKNTLFSDSKAQDAFVSLWRELSSRLKKFPVNQVAYEILNEPVADNHEAWNKLIALTMTFIRSVEPERVVIIGANRWQMPCNFPFLKVPANDRNIILSTHTYAPFPFTHHTADWTALRSYTGPVQYPGPTIPPEAHAKLMKSGNRNLLEQLGPADEVWNQGRIVKEFEPAIRRAKELGLQLYCGEFGCLPTVPRKDRLAYYSDIIAAMETNEMAWANWEYKGDFGIFEWHGKGFDCGAPDVQMIDALLSGAKKRN